MVTKTLTITEDAYNLLATRKMGEESFSEEITRLLSRETASPQKLLAFFGILSDREGKKLLAAIEKRRAISRQMKKQRLREIL